MEEASGHPDVITYNATIKACQEAKQWEKALALMEQMRRRGLKPDVITYNALISSSEKGKQLELALGIFEEMKK